MTKPTAAEPADPSPGLLARARRRASSTIALTVALGAVGFGYAAIAPSSAAADQTPSADAQRGQQIYQTACITCHGRNLQGVPDRGPSLIGVGEAATYFQVATGRMPAAAQGSQIPAKPPQYTEEQVNQIAGYVQSVGGGPQVPSGNLRDGDMALGGELFRLNCAQCHNFAGKGGALSSGKSAPGLGTSTDQVIYAAMLSGPENMPVFGDNNITPAEKRAIVSYVQTLKETKDPGGNGVGRLGPVPESIVLWVAGIGALMFAVLWIGAKS
ncbi:MAG: c-type cytochrome [Actinobacteria bacterium]|nr:c-type cytochrome [Actinomycetota bacterium]MBI3688054.1 c-type cytochrome [Actinomycetota bacterium]